VTIRRRNAIVGLLFALSGAGAAAARAPEATAPEASPRLSSEDSREVTRLVDYLEGLSSATSRFVQTDARGAQSQGTFYLQRPGRARFDYDPPSGLVIASDGRNVTVVDRRLKTKHVYPLTSTPLALFLARNIRLDRGVIVRQVIREGESVTVVAEDAGGRAKGQISLTFLESPLALTGWTLKDSRGGVVKVRLGGLTHSASHDPSFFELPDPRTTPYPDTSR
jgi:outer membrane lipoprotein-sorting protein